MKRLILLSLATIAAATTIQATKTAHQEHDYSNSCSIVESASNKSTESQRIKVEEMKAIGTKSKDIYLLRSSIYPGTFFTRHIY